MPTRVEVFGDDFNRADEDPLASPWAGGYTGASNLQIIGLECMSSAIGTSTMTITSALANDQYGQVTLSAITSSDYLAVLLRAGAGADNTYYEFSCFDGGGGCRIVYRLAGSNIASVAESPATTTWTTGDILLAEAIGTTLNLYKNTFESAVLVTMTNSALTSGRGGVTMNTAIAVSEIKLVDSSFGDVVSAAVDTPSFRPNILRPAVFKPGLAR